MTTKAFCLTVLYLILACIHYVESFPIYRSCMDVLNDKGQNATDGEFVIFLENKIGVEIYCHDFRSLHPKEYLTLKAGRSSNYASFYDNVGSKAACADLYPQQNYTGRGRTEFTKLRLNTRLLVVDTGDFTFTKQFGPNKIRYGWAGDKFSSSPSCASMGTFAIDLSGTPFSLVSETKWAWEGNYSRGNVIDGHATVKNNTYLGCWQTGYRAFRGPGYSSNTGMTQQACVKICRGYGISLAGLQGGNRCVCPMNYDTIGPASEDSCDKPCSGDPNQICGGLKSVSVYSSDVGQKFEGRCGGYPGHCFPTTAADPTVEKLKLGIADGHKCFDSSKSCRNEGKCVAVGSSGQYCQCYKGYGGHDCSVPEEIRIDKVNASCPAGYLPEGCLCKNYTCGGARIKNDVCVTKVSQPQLVCRVGDTGHIMFTEVTGYRALKCPENSKMVSCTFETTRFTRKNYGGYGQGMIRSGVCTFGCSSCVKFARCKHTICNCGVHGHCNIITGRCECDLGYYGDECELFDYCSYYEDLNNKTACTNGGICRAVYKKAVKAYAGDKTGDTCIFPFTYKGVTYSSCVEEDKAGPPFACGGSFRKSSGYIDLGMWSPGNKYTIAAWVRPAGVDTIRRTVVGGVQDCNDFGFNLNSGTFRGFLKLSKECTRDLDAGKPMVTIGQWYMVAITNNATHAVIYQNGEYRESNTVLMNHYPTTKGFRIGGEVCCPMDYFNGMIRTVKVWKRALSREEINRSMYQVGTFNSTVEALHGGLIGHWELADPSLPPCQGIDHQGADWIMQDGQILIGIHCNISRFFVPRGVTALIHPYNGTAGGKVDITAKTILIDGIIRGTASGYRGASSNDLPGAGGKQGESYTGIGQTAMSANRGGGGGGKGGSVDGSGTGGGGGGYGSVGRSTSYTTQTDERIDCYSGDGSGGSIYGDELLTMLYIGSGGGSGGNALDLSTSPKGGHGGNGGGAIKLTAELSITVNGGIYVDGGIGEGDVKMNRVFNPMDMRQSVSYERCPAACNLTSCKSNNKDACWDESGPGGGGSGGSIYLTAKFVRIGSNRLSARGGLGGKGTIRNCGGDGGRGRIRIDSVTLAGSVSAYAGQLVKKNMTNLFFDHSQGGQKLIDLQHTKYGNEVYRGCFYKTSIFKNVFGYTVPLTTHIRRLMMPDYCIYRCREKGYTFSGTSDGQECYCDNHLQMEYKVHDRECNISCDGDPLQMCGGDSRLQVFGPPPSSPAIGYGVFPKCEPWCVTADPDTDNPKWGLCSPHKPTITDWKIQCDCPPGKRGDMCDELCPQWTYGSACKRNCSCNEPNTAYCEATDGACKCKPGFEGIDCNTTCIEGFFGQDCASPCNCSNNAICDAQSGACKCRPGWTGADCQFPCPKNKYGIDCNQTCTCNHGSCAPDDGECQCDPGYKLPFCYERCDPTNYGQDCELFCDCNGQFCDSVTGLCRCGPGYIGNKCDILCPHGTWGQGCHNRCPCQNGFGCDHVTGECRCGPGFIGEKCDKQCPYGSYGSDCLGTCSCVMNHTSVCSAINGACICLPGFHGYNCEKACGIGFYGEGCKKKCTCLHGAACKPESGKCLCGPGFIGNRCEVPCPDRSYGTECQNVCQTCKAGICSKVDGSCICTTGSVPCQCPFGYTGPNCTQPDTCVHAQSKSAVQSTSCQCLKGWIGANCDQPCPDGKYGYNCTASCRCVNGTCDPVEGRCTCNAGYQNSTCSTPCTEGTYGPGCRFQCQQCGAHAFPGCDAVSGNCVCSDGYTGQICDRPCPQGTYGKNCSYTCSCNNGGFCDSVTGKCICPAGYTGPQCNLMCSAGSWGVGCSETCDCGPHGTGCSFDEGICICKSGFTGVKCRESCPVGTYGNNCSKPCHCDAMHGRCSPIDGSCLCDSGWTGDYCDFVCSTGWWGRGCTQECACNERGTCNPFNGVCDCDAGYLGPACDQQCKQDIYWGENCANKCDCNGGHCDHRTGVCTCPPGKVGHRCQKGCDSSHFGFLCAQLCGCQNNAKCDPVTGFCSCQPGWSGEFCTEPCPEGYFGVDCGQPCPLCLNGGSCDTFNGLCKCPPGYKDSLCNTSTSGVTSRLTDTGTSSVNQGGVVLTVGQLVGLIIGFVLLVLLAIIIAVIFTRKKYVGRFGNQAGAMQFEEEMEIKEAKKSADVAATSTGFINPLNRNQDFDEHFPDSRSEISESTSGVASNAVESDDDDADDDKNDYFRDSAT